MFKNVSVKRAAKNAQFFYVFRFKFLENEFKRFLLKLVVKGLLSKHKEEHLIALFNSSFQSIVLFKA